jgi:hypothetical protein
MRAPYVSTTCVAWGSVYMLLQRMTSCTRALLDLHAVRTAPLKCLCVSASLPVVCRLSCAGSRWVPVKRGGPLVAGSCWGVGRNTCSCTTCQQHSCVFVGRTCLSCAGSRWVPVKRGAPLSGILVLRDLAPDEPIEYASSGTAGGPAAPGAAAAAAAGSAGAAGQQPQQQEQEAAPPAPFGEFG